MCVDDDDVSMLFWEMWQSDVQVKVVLVKSVLIFFYFNRSLIILSNISEDLLIDVRKG